MNNVTATATGGTNSYGVYNDSSSPSMNNVTATATGGTDNRGVYNWASSPSIRNSSITGATHSISNVGTSNAKVADTALGGSRGRWWGFSVLRRTTQLLLPPTTSA